MARDIYEHLGTYGPDEKLLFDKTGMLLPARGKYWWVDHLARMISQRVMRRRVQRAKAGGRRKGEPEPADEAPAVAIPIAALAIGLALLGLVVFGIVFLLRDGGQTVRVEMDPALAGDATVSVWLDGKEMEIAGLGETIKLKPGRHGYEIRRGDEVIAAREFTILKGDNPALRISVEEEAVAAVEAKPTTPPATVAQARPEKSIAAKATSPTAAGPSPTAGRELPGLAIAPFDEAQANRHQREWAEYLGVPVQTTNSIGMKMILIPPGEFQMGSSQEEIDQLVTVSTEEGWQRYVRSQGPRHRVRLTRPFYLAVYEVTQEEYEQVEGANPSHFSSAGDGKDKVAGRPTSRHPVETVSWLQAVKFCNKLSVREKRRPCYVIEGDNVTVVEGDGYRLPTEAEWEYACWAGSAGKYCFGDSASELGQYAWCGENSAEMTHPVGEKVRNGFGLYDIHGNVCEWCLDWHDEDYYAGSPTDDPTGPPTGRDRVFRGGSWAKGDPHCRAAFRQGGGPRFRWYHLGFRVVSVISPGGTTGPARIAEQPATKPVPAGRTPAPKPGEAPPLAIAPFDASQAKRHQQTWADHLSIPVEMTNSIGMKMILIPPGEFQMGSPQEEIDQLVTASTEEGWQRYVRSQGPRHRVRLTRPFYLAVYEVTQEEYEQVMGANRSHFSSAGDGKDKVAGQPTSRHPVERVSWLHAVDFCNKLSVRERRRPCYVIEGDNVTVVEGDGYRLPTEAEWEYACRAGSAGKYCFGDSESELGQRAWYGSNSALMTHLVGEKLRNGFGLYDIHGNVWEWCQDWGDEDYYAGSPTDDPTGPPTGSDRVLRGGSWGRSVRACRSAYRSWYAPGFRPDYLGFRVVSVISPGGTTGPARIAEHPATKPVPAGPPDAATLLSRWTFSEPVNLGPTVNSSESDHDPHLSTDGLTLVFGSTRPGGQGDYDLWMSTRASADESFGMPVNLGPRVCSSAYDHGPALSAAGLMLLFGSGRPGGQGGTDLWMCTRQSLDQPFGQPVNLGPTVNSSDDDDEPHLSTDGLALVFASARPGGQGSSDLWMSTRASADESFGMPVNFGPRVCSSDFDQGPALSVDGLMLLFSSGRPGGQGGTDLWMCTRQSLDQPFGQPVNLGPTVNSSGSDEDPHLSADGQTLFFRSRRPGGQGDRDLWMTRIEQRGGPPPPAAAGLPKGTPAPKSGQAPPLAVAPFDSAQAKRHQQTWADHLSIPVEMTNSIGMKLVLIPPGEFQMGSPQEEIDQLVQSSTNEDWHRHVRSEGPRHRVRLTRPFYLAVCEVTQEGYEQVMGSNPSHFSSAGDGKDKVAGRPTSRHPVEMVSWLDAVDFCNKLSVRERRRPCYVIEGDNVTVVAGDGYRLPTEAEWEYACRAGSAGKYCFGDSESELGQYAWHLENSAYMTHPVGEKVRNGFGLYDIHGNVVEWCQDRYDEDYYARSPTDDPTGPPTGGLRVRRGGGWWTDAGLCRAASRDGGGPRDRYGGLGFRVAAVPVDASGR